VHLHHLHAGNLEQARGDRATCGTL
jgi:hypothetical protein